MRHIFAHPSPGSVVDADEDHRRDHAFADQAIARFVDLPVDARERSRRLEQVLAIVQIEDGVTAPGILAIVVTGWQPHSQKTGVVKRPAVKLVQAEIAGSRTRPGSRDRTPACPHSLFAGFLPSGNVHSQNITAEDFMLSRFPLYEDGENADQGDQGERNKAQNAPRHQFVGFDVGQIEREGQSR